MTDNNSKLVSIYCKHNAYGYRYNINHPRISDLYNRFRKWKNIDSRPLTDSERFEFEKYLDGIFKKG